MNSQLHSNLTIIVLLSYLFVTGCSTVPDRNVQGMPILEVEKQSADNYAVDVNSEHPADLQSPGTNELDSLTASVPQESFASGIVTGEGKAESEELIIAFKMLKRDNTDKRLSIGDYQNAVVTIIASAGYGAGFIISEDGYVLTNQHIVGGERFVKIKLATGIKVTGEVIRTETAGDVALIKLEKDIYPYVLLGNSSLLDIDDEVYSIGTSSKKSLQIVTKGRVSSFIMEKGLRYIQSDVTVRGSNGGGPLVSMQNGVVGICAAGHSFLGSPGGHGLNQFIPIEDAITMLNINDDKISIQNIGEII